MSESSSMLSGIKVSESGEKIIPGSKRADGTVRKERKVRAGFTPAEDVARYVNPKVAERSKPSIYSQNGGPVGHAPLETMQDIMKDRKKSKPKKKSKKATETDTDTVTGTEKVVLDPTDIEISQSLKKSLSLESEIAMTEKRRKAVLKKIRQIELLEEKGVEALDADQLLKVSRKSQLLEELEQIDLLLTEKV